MVPIISKLFYRCTTFILDRENDAMAYESLGSWHEMMEDDRGARYRTWNFYDPSRRMTVIEKYPKFWEDYFCRPTVYPQTPMGKLIFCFILMLDDQLKLRFLVYYGLFTCSWCSTNRYSNA